MERQQFVDNVITNVRALSIVEVVSPLVKLVQRGSQHLGICPFHNDKRLGSFVVTNKKGIWKCFACGEGGDSIKFVSLMSGKNYVESAFNIALQHGVITCSEYNEYFERRRYSEQFVRKVENKFSLIDKNRFQNDIADDATLDKVFNLFIDTVREHYSINDPHGLYEGLLSKEHKKHLMEVRGLSEKEIEDGKFFTFPTRAINKRFSKVLSENGEDESVLEKVPGFYKEKGKIFFTFSCHKGIGIGIKNVEGKVVGIQIRHDVKEENKSRYVWFSSSFASYDANMEYGTSSGSPIDVVYPDKLTNCGVFITEGRFKAMQIAKHMHSVALSVQGVSSWKGALDELQKVKSTEIIKNLTQNKPPFKINEIYLAFDADMKYNNAVYTQARKLSDKIQEEYGKEKVFYLSWDISHGKGIDDVILANLQNNIGKYNKKLWDEGYNAMIKILLEEHKGKTIAEIPSETLQCYFDKYVTLKPIPKKNKR